MTAGIITTQTDYYITSGATAKIQLQTYDSNWPILFSKEKHAILKAVGENILGIQHVGSTAIPGIPAKPTIDICIGVADLQIADKAIIQVLINMDYSYLQFLADSLPDRRYLQKLDEQGNHLFHLHIVIINQKLWQDYILFREYLISDAVEKETYTKLKFQLQEKFADNRVGYTEGKSSYIAGILVKAAKKAILK